MYEFNCEKIDEKNGIVIKDVWNLDEAMLFSPFIKKSSIVAGLGFEFLLICYSIQLTPKNEIFKFWIFVQLFRLTFGHSVSVSHNIFLWMFGVFFNEKNCIHRMIN